jgi:hypothetical protein
MIHPSIGVFWKKYVCENGEYSSTGILKYSLEEPI